MVKRHILVTKIFFILFFYVLFLFLSQHTFFAMVTHTEVTVELAQLCKALDMLSIHISKDLPIRNLNYELDVKRTLISELFTMNKKSTGSMFSLNETHLLLHRIYDMHLVHSIACFYHDALYQMCLSGICTMDDSTSDAVDILNKFSVSFNSNKSLLELADHARNSGFSRSLSDIRLHSFSSEEKECMLLYDNNALNYLLHCYQLDCRYVDFLSSHFSKSRIDIDAVLDRPKMNDISKNINEDKQFLYEIDYSSNSSTDEKKALYEIDYSSKISTDNYSKEIEIDLSGINLNNLFYPSDSEDTSEASEASEAPKEAQRLNQDVNKNPGNYINGAGGIVVSFISLTVSVIMSKSKYH